MTEERMREGESRDGFREQKLMEREKQNFWNEDEDLMRKESFSIRTNKLLSNPQFGSKDPSIGSRITIRSMI